MSKLIHGFLLVERIAQHTLARCPHTKLHPSDRRGRRCQKSIKLEKKRQIGQICTFQFFNLIFSSLTCSKEIIGHMVGVARIEGWKCHLSIDKTLKEKNISTYKVSFFPINIKRIPVCRALEDQPVLGMGSSGAVKILKILKNT